MPLQPPGTYDTWSGNKNEKQMEIRNRLASQSDDPWRVEWLCEALNSRGKCERQGRDGEKGEKGEKGKGRRAKASCWCCAIEAQTRLKRNVHIVVCAKGFIAIGALPHAVVFSFFNALPAKDMPACFDRRVFEVDSANSADCQCLLNFMSVGDAEWG